MAGPNKKMVAAAEAYFADLRRVRSSGGATGERSCYPGNLWLSAAPHLRKNADEPQACVTRHLACLHLIERGANLFPAYCLDTDGALLEGAGGDGPSRQPNLTPVARRYVERLGASVEDLFHHVVAVLHDPTYRESKVLGRNLKSGEVWHFTDTARRIGALLLATSDGPERSSQ